MPGMTAIEMPLFHQAITNAFAILLLFVVGCWLLYFGVRRFRELWRQYKLALAFDASADRKRLLRMIFESPSETPEVRFVRKNPLCEAADAEISCAADPHHPRIRKQIRLLLNH